MLLHEFLTKDYTKDDLKYMSDSLFIKKVSSLKKSDLAKKIADKMLDPKIMFERVCCMTDSELEVFLIGLKGPYEIPESLAIDAITMQTSFRYGYFGEEDDKLYIPDDVKEAWSKIDIDEFNRKHSDINWMMKCFHFVRTLYGTAPVDVLIELLETKKNWHMDIDDLIELSHSVPIDLSICEFIDDMVVDLEYAVNPEELRYLLKEQGDKDFYIPTYEEINELADTACIISKKPYQDLKKALVNKVGLEAKEAEITLMELWHKIAIEDDPHGTMNWFMNEIVFDSEKQVQEIINLYMAVCNSTNMLVNRGYAPIDMPHPPIKPGQMPTIVPGSTKAARMLTKVAPFINEKGFELDLSADEYPVMGFPNGINKEASIGVKKVYPNDPCPCGSGKKYKKCCGR